MAGAAGSFGHSFSKYRRFNKRGIRSRYRTRYGRKSSTFTKRKRRSTKKRNILILEFSFKFISIEKN